MGNLFTNYNYIPAGYVPNNTKPVPIASPAIKLPLEEYNHKGEFIGYSWRYNDTILLEFSTEGEVLYHNPDVAEDAETYLADGKTFLLEFFNFRYELMYSEEVPASDNLKYYIPQDLCEKMIPNTYAIQVTLIDKENDVRQTMIDRRDLKIYVR